MPKTANTQIAVIGIDIGKNSFHVVGLDRRGAIVLRQKWSRGQVGERLANMPPSLIGNGSLWRGASSERQDQHARP
jgi:transposase